MFKKMKGKIIKKMKGKIIMNKIRRILPICIMITCFLIHSSGITADAASNWTDLGQGYKVRWDNPHVGDGRYHAHVYKKGAQIGSERCGGGASHKDQFRNVDKKIRDQVRSHKKYKQGAEKNRQLDKAAKEIRRRNLNKAGKIGLAIALVVGATGTFFFPGDDIAAWSNLIRTIVYA